MKSQRKIGYTFLIFLLFSESFFSQAPLGKYRGRFDPDILQNFIARANDTVFVSNSYEYKAGYSTNDNDFYFYNTRTKKRIFPYGFEMAYPFVGKTAVVKYKERWGLIDLSGKFIYYSDSPSPVKLTMYEKYAVFDEQVMYDVGSGLWKESSIYCAEPAASGYFLTKTKTGKYNLHNSKNEPVFKTDVDTIITQDHLLYGENSGRNLLIVKNKNKYGVFQANGNEVFKIKYEKAKFVGNYIMLFEKNVWNYYTYQNNKMNWVLSSPYECMTPAYQTHIIGAFKKDNTYNLLKTNGEIVQGNFDYISDRAAYGIKENTVVIFDSHADYYTYIEK